MALPRIIIIFGPTASGKTAYAIKLAKTISDSVIINADSMQVYQGLETLTAQPTIEEKGDVPHLLYGYYSCYKKYHLHKWLNDVIPSIDQLRSSGVTPILVGGTGMYIKALIDGFTDIKISDELGGYIASLNAKELNDLFLKHCSDSRLHANDIVRRKRLLEITLHNQPQNIVKKYQRNEINLIMISKQKTDIYNNINLRFSEMVRNGVIEEVRHVYNHGIPILPKPHGLPEIIRYLNGFITLNEAITKAQQITRNYAKRQLTFARHQLTFDEIINL